MNNLLNSKYHILDQPDLKKLEESVLNNNILVLIDPGTEAGKKLSGKLPGMMPGKTRLKSHQLNAEDFTEINAFCLENGAKKIFAISSKSKELREKVLVSY